MILHQLILLIVHKLLFIDSFDRNVQIYNIFIEHMSLRNNSGDQFEEGQALQSKMINSELFVKVASKKKLIVSDLDLNNPQDRALSLCLKMIQFRKKQQRRQQRIIEQFRKSRVTENLLVLGNLSTIIDHEHSIARHQYLRQNHYRSARPNKAIIQLLPIGNQEKRKDVARQIDLLQRSKKVSKRYEIRKMVEEILLQATDIAITMHQRKKKFKAHPVKHNSKEEKNWERRAKGKKGCLSLSRVLDLKMAPPQQEEHSEDQPQSQDQSKSNSNESKEEEKEDEDSQQESSSSSSSDSSGEKQQQEQQGEQDKQQKPQLNS